MRNFWDKLQEKGPILALAPMAGVTDTAFRQMCKKFGADLVYSEMVSVEGLQHAPDKILTRADFEEMERPIIVQLMGSNPKSFAKAAKQLEELGIDGIDINFGCPAKNIVKSCAGASLMDDLDLAHDILEATINATSLPVSCKIRISKYSKKLDRDVTGLEFVEKMKDLDVKALMVHGRKYEKVHAGDVDYIAIKKIKQAFKGIVLANGGVNSPERAKEVLGITGADGVGIARGAQGKPYIFKQIKQFLKKGKYKEYNVRMIKKITLKHLKLSYKHKNDRGLLEIRKHLTWYIKGMQGASKVRKELMQSSSLDEIKKIIKSI